LLFIGPGVFPAGGSFDGAASFELRGGDNFEAEFPAWAPPVIFGSFKFSASRDLETKELFDSITEEERAAVSFILSLKAPPDPGIGVVLVTSVFRFESVLEFCGIPRSFAWTSLPSLLVLIVPTEGREPMLEPLPIDPLVFVFLVENKGLSALS